MIELDSLLELDPAEPETFKRDARGLERAFHLYSQQFPAHFCVVFKIAGEIDPLSYRDAFDVVQRCHPLLSVYISDENGRIVFHKSGRRIQVRILPSHAGDWKEIVAEELAGPFEQRVAPLIRATVLHAVDYATIVITFHHSIADGLSGTVVARDLMRALSDQPLQVRPDLPPCSDLVEKTFIRPEVGPPAAETPPPLPQADPLLWSDNSGQRPSVEDYVLTSEMTGRLAKRCQREKTTIHGAICAAVMGAAAPIRGDGPFRIMSPIDVRGLLGVGRDDCGLFVNSGRVHFRNDRRNDFWEIARHATDELAPNRSAEALIASTGAFEFYLPADADHRQAADLLAFVAQSETMVSNLGMLPFGGDFGPLEMTAFWGPAVLTRMAGEQVIGVATLGGTLRMIHCSHEPIPHFLENIGRSLREAAEA